MGQLLYQRTTTMITSGVNRNPAKLGRSARKSGEDAQHSPPEPVISNRNSALSPLVAAAPRLPSPHIHSNGLSTNVFTERCSSSFL